LTHLIREDGSKFEKLSALPFAAEKPLKDGGYNIFFSRERLGGYNILKWGKRLYQGGVTLCL
jgi:hypothetical protein